MYYVNDGVYGSFNCILYDHYTVEASVLDVSANVGFHRCYVMSFVGAFVFNRHSVLSFIGHMTYYTRWRSTTKLLTYQDLISALFSSTL